MKNLTLNDPTQSTLLKHLKVTEELLARAASFASGSDQCAEIYAMPDLGLPHNVTRIQGGFYTGALYTWETKVPIVPVDATVNACGASVFRLEHCVQDQTHFNELIQNAIAVTETRSSYVWNFASGNHFILYGESKGSPVLPDGYYAVLHSGAAEFKNQHNGLYPDENNWFFDSIKTLEDSSNNRYIRFIEGRVAERFIEQAHILNRFNQARHRYFAELVFGKNNVIDEISNKPHYGMPTKNSVSIGCQWISERSPFILLTGPQKPLFFIQPTESASDCVNPNFVNLDGQDFILHPHGLGKQAKYGLDVCYELDGIVLNGKSFCSGDSIENEGQFELRSFQDDEAFDKQVPEIVSKILEACPGEVIGVFQPKAHYYRGYK